MRHEPTSSIIARRPPAMLAKGAGAMALSAVIAVAAGRPPAVGADPRLVDTTAAADRAGAVASAAHHAGAAAAPAARRVVAEGDGPRVATIDDVHFAVDAELARGGTWDVAALRAEARGVGPRVLADGDVLRGRVVVEGMTLPEGARVFVEPGAQIISMGDMVLDGELVPLPSDPPADVADGGIDPDGHPLPAAVAGCGGTSAPSSMNGVKPPPIQIIFNGRGAIGALLVGVCAGPAIMQQPNPPFVTAVGGAGGRSARAVGGRGGDGVDVLIEGLGNSTLAILGPLCNGRGADGAKAVASAADGPACECGGDAWARGGDGGDGGRLTIVADTIIWNALLASCTVQPGGAGGGADASAGNGGSCPCPGEGGDGGDAKAFGGHAGESGQVRVLARVKMVPPPAIALATFVNFAPPPQGGTANAFAGAGGSSGPCGNCHESGGDGGDAGNALAEGGDGGAGTLLLARDGGVVVAALGADGGFGGNAQAGAKLGGKGGNGGSCPCQAPGPASYGGDGGAGGSATARGGSGGDVDGGPPPIALALPESGDGGNAVAVCGQGGPGGNGGSCFLGFPVNCLQGFGGGGGAGGTSKEAGGAAGQALGAALSGSNGVPAPPGVATTCLAGLGGFNGLVFCPPFLSSCCVASNQPGCDDPACKESICANLPLCCDFAWDQACADQANLTCAVCQGPSDCCVANGGAGCDDPACEKVVCFMNPLCCDAVWDAACAEVASQVCDVCAGSS